MTFTKQSANLTPIEDTVFAIVKMANDDINTNGEENVVNATIGSLFNEEGKLVAFETVFSHYDDIPKEVKAAYADSFVGNDNFREDVKQWVLHDNCDLHCKVIATPGGTGSVWLTINTVLDKDDTLIIPDIAWGSYALMARQNQNNLRQYNMFKNDCFDMENFKQVCIETAQQQEKLCVIINDPCHNPSGYSLSKKEWEEIIDCFNEISKTKPVVLLNDIAYIDYAADSETARHYIQQFSNLSSNCLVVMAFSCSKTCTSYGLRCGAALLLGKDETKVREVEIVFEKAARSTWSNISNSAMENFSYLVNDNKENFQKELSDAVTMLKQRSDLFIKEAKENDLPTYPFVEGFFVTINTNDNNYRDKLHQALIDNHIYTVKVNKGIRVAICSVSMTKIKGLAKKIKDIANTLN